MLVEIVGGQYYYLGEFLLLRVCCLISFFYSFGIVFSFIFFIVGEIEVYGGLGYVIGKWQSWELRAFGFAVQYLGVFQG